MNTPNAVLIASAKESLRDNWGLAAKFLVVNLILTIIIRMIPIIGNLAYLIVSAPLYIGTVIFWLSLTRNQDARVNQLFEGFHTFRRSLNAVYSVGFYTLLWTLLFIIPGIIASYSYMMTFFIMVDDKNIKTSDAIDKSKQMMMGNKMKLFKLHLRFIGWSLLVFLLPIILYLSALIAQRSSGVIVTAISVQTIIFMVLLFISFVIFNFWITPYAWVATAKFYDDIKGEDLSMPSMPDVAVPVAVPSPTPVPTTTA